MTAVVLWNHHVISCEPGNLCKKNCPQRICRSESIHLGDEEAMERRCWRYNHFWRRDCCCGTSGVGCATESAASRSRQCTPAGDALMHKWSLALPFCFCRWRSRPWGTGRLATRGWWRRLTRFAVIHLLFALRYFYHSSLIVSSLTARIVGFHLCMHVSACGSE